MARQVVASGAIGDLRMLSQSIVGPAPGWSEGQWLHDHELVRRARDRPRHSQLRLPGMVIGEQPVRVQTVAADSAAGPNTYALVTLRYANGAIGTVETSWAHPAAYGFKVATEISGSRGRLWWDYDSDRWAG